MLTIHLTKDNALRTFYVDGVMTINGEKRAVRLKTSAASRNDSRKDFTDFKNSHPIRINFTKICVEGEEGEQ